MAKNKKDNVVDFPSVKAGPNPVIQLSRFLQAALAGLQAREREVEREHIAPLREDFVEFVKAVEKEYDVKLGQTHSIAPDGKLIPIPAQPEEKNGN